MSINRIIKKVLTNLSTEKKYEVLYQFARLLGVRGYLVHGHQGAFVGAISDRAIMRSYLLHSKWSTEIVDPICQALRSGGTFLDVGANIGLVSITVAKTPGVKVIAIEPDEENSAFLRANIAMHQVANIEIIKGAAWHEEAELKFARNSYNSGDHHIDQKGEVVVKAFPLDKLDVPEGPLVIKIDTQGAEPSVLQGAGGLLARANMVVAEFWPWGMQRMGLDVQVVIDILTRFQGQAQIIDHGKFGNWMSTKDLKVVLRDFSVVLSEFKSIDVVLKSHNQ